MAVCSHYTSRYRPLIVFKISDRPLGVIICSYISVRAAKEVPCRPSMRCRLGIKVNILCASGHTVHDGGSAAAHPAAVQARGMNQTYATPYPDNTTPQTPYHLVPNEAPQDRHIAYRHFIPSRPLANSVSWRLHHRRLSSKDFLGSEKFLEIKSSQTRPTHRA